MKTINFLLFSFVAIIFLSGCVSYQKYEDLQLAKSAVDLKNSELQQELTDSASRSVGMNQELKELKEANATLKSDLEGARLQYQLLNQSNKDLLMRYEKMLQQNEQVIATTSSEKKDLTERLAEKELELNKREEELEQLANEIKEKEKNVAQLQSELSEREKRVKELEMAIAEKDNKLAALREKVNQALLGFSAADLSVREEKGKVYVSLSQNLLFRSGSKTINSAGKDAIRKLGMVLSTNPDIAIMVEGHTDSDGDANLNWDLSVGRATSVVKELEKSGIAPQQITAAGRGEYFPIASNDTSDGKAQNRRTEIILSPNLDALLDIINN